MKPEILVGIDVAYAKKKRLPLCIAMQQPGQLVPIETTGMKLPEIPRGRGNVGALDAGQVMHFAQAVLNFLQAVELQIGGCIVAIAIDAHWRTRHEEVMSYEAFWGSLCEPHRA